MEKFINYGDAHPLDHGGFIVEPATGQVVFFDGQDDGQLLVHRTSLDVVDDGWIDWDAVGASCGWVEQHGSIDKAVATLDPAVRLQCAVGFYGAADFDSAPDDASAHDLGVELAPVTENFAL